MIADCLRFSMISVLALCLTVLTAATGYAFEPAPVAQGANGAVAADHSMASEAGVAILKSGGNALDAALAAMLANGVAHASGNGIGGGGFMVYWSAREGRAYALDFRERAPAALTSEVFYEDGKPSTRLSQRGGLAVGIPGEVAGMKAASDRFGRLPFRRLFAPAIALAEGGYPVTRYLSHVTELLAEEMQQYPHTAAMYAPGGRPLRAGALHRNRDLAWTLRQIASDSGESFYGGPLGHRIEQAVQAHGGVMTAADLASYRPTWREPVAGELGDLQIFSMPPPSSGGAIVIEILKCLERLPISWNRPRSAWSLHYLAEVEKHGFADRATSFGDPDYVNVPVARMLSPEHFNRIARSVKAGRTSDPEVYVHQLPDDCGTTHVSAMDRDGNACAITSSINTHFGSLVTVPGTGIVLNNHMDDFSLAAGVANAFGLVGGSKNIPAAGKRPLSSMSPTIVVRQGKPVMAVGASGGPRIITGTLTVLTNVLLAGMDVGAAISAPRIHHQWKPDEIRAEREIGAATIRRLRSYGHRVKPGGRLSAVQAVVAVPGGFRAAADPTKNSRAAAY